MKKTTILATVFILLLQTIPVLAATPDFSGVWEMEMSRSTLTTTLPVEAMTLKVWQTDKDLRIENTMKVKQTDAAKPRGGDGTMLQIAVYDFNGETNQEFDGAMARKETRRATVTADGRLNLLVVRDFKNEKSGTAKVNEIWELLDAGKTLKITRYSETPRGATNAEMYFTKSPAVLTEADKSGNKNPRVVLDPNAPPTAPQYVLVGLAIKLVKPDYPAVARGSGAGGAVTVQVTLDETGKVVAVEAISGHSLLRKAAENAAKKSKFKPATVDGKAVQMTGVVTYNFAP